VIRLAVKEDVGALCALVKRHHADNPHLPWKFDAAAMSMGIATAIAGGPWLCLTGPGSLFLAVHFDSPIGAGRLAVEQIVIAETPGAFDEMRVMFEDWARSHGCVRAAMGCTTKPHVFARLYGKHGYMISETIFSKGL
jgi:hypothetical protein